MHKDDAVRLQHMLDAATEAMRSAHGRAREDLNQDHVWALGIVKCVEIIGEAAARIGEDLQAKHPQIPWSQIVAMRNRLVHAYFDIDLDQVWKAVSEDLPSLAAELQRILDAEGED